MLLERLGTVRTMLFTLGHRGLQGLQRAVYQTTSAASNAAQGVVHDQAGNTYRLADAVTPAQLREAERYGEQAFPAPARNGNDKYRPYNTW
jgi:hypothetical protein